MAQSIQTNLTQGSVVKSLIRYSLPMVGTSLLQALYSIIDLIIVGQYIGGSAVSAVNNGTLIMNLVTQIIIGFTVGGNILIGRYFGSKEADNYKSTAGTLFTLCLVSGVGGSLLLILLSHPMLVLLGAPSLDMAVSYLDVCALGTAFIFGYNALSAILRGLGNSKKPLHFILIATLINIVLDYFFVAQLNLGVRGAALATLIAQGVSFLLALGYVLQHREIIGFTRQYLRPDLEKARKIIRVGFPVALQWTIASASWLVVAFLINQHGVDVSAGNGISNKIKEFCQLFISAMMSAAATMAAQNLGAGANDRAKAVMYTCLKVTLLVAGICILIVQLFAPQLVSIFIDEPAVAQHAILNLRIEIIAQLFYAGFMSYHVLALAAGDTLFVMANSFLNCIIVRLILAIFLESQLGSIGIYLACMVAPSVSVPVGMWYCRSGRWSTPPAT